MGTLSHYDETSNLADKLVRMPATEQAVPRVGARASTWFDGHFEHFVIIIELMADLLTAFFAAQLVYAVHVHFNFPNGHTRLEVLATSFGFGLFIILLLDRENAYRRGNGLLRIRDTERVLRVCTQCFIVLFAITFVTKSVVSRSLVASLCATTLVLLLLGKQVVYWFFRWLHGRGLGVRKVLIYGAGHAGRRVFSALCRSPKLGLDPIAVLDERPEHRVERVFDLGYTRTKSAPVQHDPLTRDLLHELKIGMVVIAAPNLARDRFVQIFSEAAAAGVKVAVVPDHFLSAQMWMEYGDIDGLLLATFGGPPERRVYDITKRLFDFVLGLGLLVLVAPFWALTLILIRMDSPGPAIFRQERIGYNGKPFFLFKFRTMYSGAPAYGYSPTSSEDERITHIGRFLRRTSLDEIPQLLNVLRGEMSLVGPRPEMPFIVRDYQAQHRKRLQVKPGITGLWQLSADRAFLIHENIEYDLYYIRNRSFFMDVAILLHTVFFAMRGI
jgi:exopolysaccharide biosynthesis polyprenyl glycosylphosphotransferase